MFHGGIVVAFEQALDDPLEVEVVQDLVCERPTDVVEEVGVFNVDNLCYVAVSCEITMPI